MKFILAFVVVALICQSVCVQKKAIATNPQNLDAAYETARDAKNLRSLLVSHRGILKGEEYFDKYKRDSLDHVRSVTKSVIATLIGIAIDQRIIGIDDSIEKYFGKKAKGKEDVTVKHLLTMNSGIEWFEDDGVDEFNKWVSSGNQINYILDRPLSHKPGTHFSYNSGGTHLLSVILTKTSGKSTLDFAREHLFEPLGIKNIRWQRLSGYHNGGAGLEMKPRDMLKIGRLYLNKGLFEGQRILSESFINEATSHQAKGLPKGVEGDDGYGYCWWVGGDDGITGYAAMGYAGQLIFVVPQLDLAMVVTHRWQGLRGRSAKQSEMASTLLKLVTLGIKNCCSSE